MAPSAQASATGIGLPGLLLVLFIGLKLTGYIAWSWWWVLSPLWLPVVILVGVILLWLLAVLFVRVWKRWK